MTLQLESFYGTGTPPQPGHPATVHSHKPRLSSHEPSHSKQLEQLVLSTDHIILQCSKQQEVLRFHVGPMHDHQHNPDVKITYATVTVAM